MDSTYTHKHTCTRTKHLHSHTSPLLRHLDVIKSIEDEKSMLQLLSGEGGELLQGGREGGREVRCRVSVSTRREGLIEGLTE